MNQVVALPRCTPEEAGIPSAAIAAFLKAVEQEQLGVNSFMLMRHGQVAAEAWWYPYAPELPHMMFSISKSFTSTAIGLCVQQGLLTVEDLVVSFFPDKTTVDSGKFGNLRIKHLLTMTTGHTKEAISQLANPNVEDWVQAFLASELEHEPGTFYAYNNLASYMLSAIVHKVTGQSVHEFLRPRLYEPLGITNSTWGTCPRGITLGGWGLSIPTEDLLKFGQLYLQKGRWNGEQLVPEEWVEEATSYKVNNENHDPSGARPDWGQGYAYQFWNCRHNVYRAEGMLGQFCLVIPEYDAVVAITSGTQKPQAILDAVWEHLLPAMNGTSLAPDPTAYAALQEAISERSYTALTSTVDAEAFEQRISGTRYVLKENDARIEAVTLRFEDGFCEATLTIDGNESAVRAGKGEWIVQVGEFDGAPSSMAASCGWETPDTLTIRRQFLETPFHELATFRFEEERVMISVSFLPSNRPLLSLEGQPEQAAAV